MGWENRESQDRLRARMRHDSAGRKARERAREAARNHMENRAARLGEQGGICGVIVLAVLVVAVMSSLGFSLLLTHVI